MSDDSTLENTRKPGRQKGCQKTGGRIAGTPNKSTGFARQKLQECFEDNDFDYGKELTGALYARELDYAEVLIKLIDYVYGKVPQQKPIEGDASAEDLGVTVNLSALIK